MGRRRNRLLKQRVVHDEDIERTINLALQQVRQHSKEVQNACVPIVKGLTNKIVFTGSDVIPSFTASEFINALSVNAVDMSQNLLQGEEMCFSTFASDVEEEHLRLRLYLRDANNGRIFAKLQYLVETCFFERPIGVLQGWLIHFGNIFMFGGPRLSLQESVFKVKDNFRVLLTSDELLCTLPV